MKLSSYITALAITAAGFASAVSAATITAANGNIILGFQTTTGIGSASNVEVNLGTFTNYNGLFATQTTPLLVANLGADLTATYGTGAGNSVNWNARTDVIWAFGGKTGTTTVSNYVSFVETTAGTQSTAPTTSSFSFGNLGTASGNIGIVVTGINGLTSTANDNLTAIVAASSGGSFSTGFASDSLGYGFYTRTDIANTTTVSGSDYVVSDLYKLTSNNTGSTKSVTYVGSFGLASDGKLYYANNASAFAAAAIPEPSTYAAIFGVVMLGFAVSRRRIQNKN